MLWGCQSLNAKADQAVESAGKMNATKGSMNHVLTSIRNLRHSQAQGLLSVALLSHTPRA